MLLQNCPPVLSSISVFSICKGCQSFSKHKILGACKHKQIPVLHRCEQTRWRPMPLGRLPGHWYRVDLILWGEIHQRWTLYYGSLLRETMGLTSTKNKYLFAQWDGEHRDLHTGPRSLDYNSLLLHLKIPIHTPRSSFCVWPPAYNMIQLQCLMNELNRIIWKTVLCCCIGVNNYIQLLWEA